MEFRQDTKFNSYKYNINFISKNKKASIWETKKKINQYIFLPKLELKKIWINETPSIIIASKPTSFKIKLKFTYKMIQPLKDMHSPNKKANIYQGDKKNHSRIIICTR